jgi:hypothetical protein
MNCPVAGESKFETGFMWFVSSMVTWSQIEGDMTSARPFPADPAPDLAWEVWYRDTFDDECPRQCEIKGAGLVHGLTELWARYLCDTVRTGGGYGFCDFHLRLCLAEIGITVKGPWEGAVRLRQWIFGDKEYTGRTCVNEDGARLLESIAVTHAFLHLTGKSSQSILEAALSAATREAFEDHLRYFNAL